MTTQHPRQEKVETEPPCMCVMHQSMRQHSGLHTAPADHMLLRRRTAVTFHSDAYPPALVAGETNHL
jgi:hypothetical protein